MTIQIDEATRQAINELPCIDDIDAIFTDPQVNTTRSVRIVYSIDSAFSTISASLLKRILDARMDHDTRAFYDIQFTEVGNLLIEEVADSYLWLGMFPVEDAVSGLVINEFESSQHLTVERAFKEEGLSHFDEALIALTEADGRQLKSVLNETKPLTQAEMTANQLIGFLSTSLSRLSYAIPELKMDNIESELIQISNIENMLITFYSKTAPVDLLIRMWVTMNKALCELGHPYRHEAVHGNDEEKLIGYIDHFRLVRKELQRHGDHLQTFYSKDERRQKCVVTNASTDFWLLRRFIVMSNEWYHNTRLTHYGIHTETNVVERVNSYLELGRSKNNH